jgi:hypothetical protein
MLLRSSRRTIVALLCVVTLMTTTTGLVRPAGEDKRLDRIKGQVGYTTVADGPVHEVFGHDILPDDDFAITRDRSAAELVLPDSSIDALGENTNVKVGAFTTGAAGPGSTIQVQGGTLRFDIRRPAGATANYHFTTTTSQIAVRGTVGLLSFIGGNTTVVCLTCAADSVTVVTGTQTITVVTGQIVTISASGAVVTSTVTSTALSTFSSAQVSTSAASGSSAAVSGIAGVTTGISTGAIAGVAAGVAAGAAVVTTANKSNPTPAPTPTPTPTPAPTATPTPGTTPTPNAPIQIQRHEPAPAPAPLSVTPPPRTSAPAAPLPASAPAVLPRGGVR